MASQKIKTFFNLLSPSSTGLIVAVTVSLFITFGQVLLVDNHFTSAQKIGRVSTGIAGNWLLNAVGLTRLDTFVIYAFWVAVGIIVWILLKYTTANVSELSSDISFRHYIWPRQMDHNLPLRHFIESLVFRLAAIILLVFYTRHVIVYLLYIMNSTSHYGVWLNKHGWWAVLILFVSWVVVWHGMVILIRLMLLRQRIFS